jgi:hypothetical protein
MKLRFRKPEIDTTKFDPATIPDYDETKIRYSYCAKPGIRLLPEYTLMCESAEVQPIKMEQLLAMDEQLIQDQARVLWNYLIGQDNGVETEMVLPDTNAVQITKLKYGYQTPKAEQEELCVYMPLQFFYNTDFKNRLNTGMFKEGTLSIHGLLERSDLIVRADYYDGLENPPIRIPLRPLEIAEHRLVSNYIRVGDYLHALDLYSIMSRIIEIVDVHKYHIKDLDNCIVLKGKGSLETMLTYIRPKGYNDDFYLWDKFSEVEEITTQIPALINGPGGDPNQCGVGVAKHYKQVKNITEIGLKWGDIDIKEVKPTIFYEVISKHRLSRQTDLFKVQNPENGIFMFLFNDHYLTRQLSCLFNMDSIREPILEIKFNENLVDLEQRLDKEYEIVVLSYTLNTISSYGRTMGINYIY